MFLMVCIPDCRLLYAYAALSFIFKCLLLKKKNNFVKMFSRVKIKKFKETTLNKFSF